MKELTVFEHNHVDVVDSRQVAEMIGKTHAHLMRDIQGYVEILTKSIESKFGFNDFFIESTYKDSIGRSKFRFGGTSHHRVISRSQLAHQIADLAMYQPE